MISSAAYTTPEFLTTRDNSRKITSRAGFRLKIPLTSATSIESSGRGKRSASARQNRAFARPTMSWPSRARSSIASLKSMPIALPSSPVRRAAIIESMPAPQPRSRTVEPFGISANIETFDTPANASTHTGGRLASSSAGYPRLRANPSPTGNGCFPPGCSATEEYASHTPDRSCRLDKLPKPHDIKSIPAVCALSRGAAAMRRADGHNRKECSGIHNTPAP